MQEMAAFGLRVTHSISTNGKCKRCFSSTKVRHIFFAPITPNIELRRPFYICEDWATCVDALAFREAVKT